MKLVNVAGERRLRLEATGVVANVAPASGAVATLSAWSDESVLEPCPASPTPLSEDPESRTLSWAGAEVVELETGPFFQAGSVPVVDAPRAYRICTYVSRSPDFMTPGESLVGQDTVAVPARPLPRCGRSTADDLVTETIPIIDAKWSYDLDFGELEIDHVRCAQLVKGGPREMAVAFRWTRPVSCLAATPWVVYRGRGSVWRVALVRIKLGHWAVTGRPLKFARGGLIEFSPIYRSQDQAFCAPSRLAKKLIRWGGASWVVRTTT